MRIALGFGMEKDKTTVEVYTGNGDASFAEAWGPIIIDELASSMMRVYPIGRGGE